MKDVGISEEADITEDPAILETVRLPPQEQQDILA